MQKIISRPGHRYKFRHLEFWAERGIVHLFDFRGNPYEPDYREIMVRDVLLRARAINASLNSIKWPDERVEHARLVEQLIACCKEAQRQGRPDQAKTFEHIRNMRNDKSILLPGSGIQAGNYHRLEA